MRVQRSTDPSSSLGMAIIRQRMNMPTEIVNAEMVSQAGTRECIAELTMNMDRRRTSSIQREFKSRETAGVERMCREWYHDRP